jgi:hypothetical protein
MCEKVPNSDLDFSTFGQLFGIISPCVPIRKCWPKHSPIRLSEVTSNECESEIPEIIRLLNHSF